MGLVRALEDSVRLPTEPFADPDDPHRYAIPVFRLEFRLRPIAISSGAFACASADT